jgi:hypothetical protein
LDKAKDFMNEYTPTTFKQTQIVAIISIFDDISFVDKHTRLQIHTYHVIHAFGADHFMIVSITIQLMRYSVKQAVAIVCRVDYDGAMSGEQQLSKTVLIEVWEDRRIVRGVVCETEKHA